MSSGGPWEGNVLQTLCFKVLLSPPKKFEDDPRRALGGPCAQKYRFYNGFCDTHKGHNHANRTNNQAARTGGRAKGRVNPPLGA